MTDLTPKMRRVLEVLAEKDRALTPNEIGYGMGDLRPKPVQTRSGSSPTAGRTVAPGSLLSSTLRSLERRKLIRYVGRGRDDGLSGSAYEITVAGRDAADPHTVAESRPYPDGTAVAVCSCGWETDASRSVDVLNYQFGQHRRARGVE